MHDMRLRVRTLILEIIRLRQEAGLGPISHADKSSREIIALAHDLNIHVTWPIYMDEDMVQMHCICGWQGDPSDDLTARLNQSLEHTMSPENFL